MSSFFNGITESISNFLGDDLSVILQNGNGVESDYQEFKKAVSPSSDVTSSTVALKNNPKYATSSYINEYAFISYGAHYLDGIKPTNTFRGPEGIVAQNGLVADHERWKNPTAKNIIEWSKTVLEKQKQPGNVQGTAEFKSTVTAGATETNESLAAQKDGIKAIDRSTRINLPPTLGALEYEWRDFAFCKHFGSIPNNRLVTLRRFKLPTLDSGAVIGRDELVNKVNKFAYDETNYLNTDSARALTYFGEGTGNTINTFVGFNFKLNWTPQQSSTEAIPTVNAGMGSSYNPFTKTNIQSSVLGDVLSGIISGNKTSSSFGLMQQVSNASNNENRDINTPDAGPSDSKTNSLKGKLSPRDVALQNAPEMSPYETGWQHRIYGPINVITSSYRRSRGLDFNSDTILLNFEYDVMQVDTLNHKIAMLDIISNILALTYADATFYGGDYRFIPQPTDVPIPVSLQDMIIQYATGQEVDFAKLSTGYKDLIVSTVGNVIDSVKEKYSKSKNSDEITKLIDKLVKATNILTPSSAKTTGKEGAEEKKNGATNNDPINQVDPLSNATGAIEDVFDALKELTGTLTKESEGGTTLNPLKYLAAGVMGKGYSISSIVSKLTVLTPLFTGEPVGEWHLTVGNPMNPFMMIGNLICTNAEINFNDTLGPDDFPTQLKVTITLRHARPRDKGDIESMFNLGQGRFYVNVQGEPEPWNTGFSSNDSGNDAGKPPAANVAVDANVVVAANVAVTDADNVAQNVLKSLNGKIEPAVWLSIQTIFNVG